VLDPRQWNPTVLPIVDVDEDDLLMCANELLLLHQHAQLQPVSNIYNKYSGRDNFRIAKIRFWPPLE